MLTARTQGKPETREQPKPGNEKAFAVPNISAGCASDWLIYRNFMEFNNSQRSPCTADFLNM
jgi:hypothetical protein